jgi:hypothetical protein
MHIELTTIAIMKDVQDIGIYLLLLVELCIDLISSFRYESHL